ncbi:MAG: nucleotidyltransferase family protein [Sulfitobacter sp.]
MRDNSTALMMFAAGFGTRMKHLTQDQPKPMIPVAGKPLIDHALALVRDANCGPIVANLHYKPDALAQHLQEQGVQTILEMPDILETGGGLRNALPLLGTDPLFTMNTDAIWAGPNPLCMLAQAWDPTSMDALLINIPIANAVGHQSQGDFTMAKDGCLSRGQGFVYGGIQIIKTNQLDQIKEDTFSLNVLWDRMLQDKRLFGLPYPGKWCDVGHPDGVTLAEDMLRHADV